MRLSVYFGIGKNAALDLVPIGRYLEDILITFVVTRHMQKEMILSKLFYYDVS